MNSQKYKDLLDERLEVELRKVEANGQAVFQHDSDPCDVSKMMLKYFKDKKISCFKWPGNTPDLKLKYVK